MPDGSGSAPDRAAAAAPRDRNVGHYDLLGTDAVSPQPFARTPWVRRWAEGGSEAMWEVLGMPRRPERIHAPIPEVEADVWSEPETKCDVVLSDKNSGKIDMETDSAPRQPERIHAPIPEAEADRTSGPSQKPTVTCPCQTKTLTK